MTNVATQLRGARKSSQKPLLYGVVFTAVICVALSVWFFEGGRETLILALQPRFRVVKIDAQNSTMLVTRLNETYRLDCARACDLFSVGKSYKMRNEGGLLKTVVNHHILEMPILQEHIEFETEPGGHG